MNAITKNYLDILLNNKKSLFLSLPLLYGASLILSKIFKKKLIIKDKFVVVTGASSGIGLEITKELLRNKSKVILIARNKDRLIQLVEDFKKEGYSECYYISADLSKENDIEECKNQINQILSESNKRTLLNQHVEILVNCAGSGNWKFLEDTSFKECQEMMSLPYFAAFNITRILLTPMLHNGIGTIVNINSPVSLQPWQGCIGYACARWALKGFTQCLRRDLCGSGVNVVEVIPGETQSGYFENNGITSESFPLLSHWIPKISPSQVGKVTVDAIINKKERVLYPFSLNIAKYIQFYPLSLLIDYLLSSELGSKRLNQFKSNQNQNKKEKEKENIDNTKSTSLKNH
ncbi:hypothetical protein DICPUDRAFT_149085 [Dictyostelium purpureum]|uniref:Uncharacterized protein n=1 Tax=Dictyostelium purpureum TaxID=5786 RepID=F0ZCT4_DICPU|nr:uncharacterized protein DICPUDRAFT_149085 [Dictyostelium purpureum]EGC38274.1 hypothetical protein DICPUDRAFT_149085 [Dictyostelium purpureum]|eukprot:XP_003285231.1 hypothetical protein DICPUDRAFT_149085 [Dictyostelium purpureum]